MNYPGKKGRRKGRGYVGAKKTVTAIVQQAQVLLQKIMLTAYQHFSFFNKFSPSFSVFYFAFFPPESPINGAWAD